MIVPTADLHRGDGVPRFAPGRRRDALVVFVTGLASRFSVLPDDRTAAEWHAAERARLERHGLPRAFADGQIAATAVTNDLTLVSRNVTDFAGFAEKPDGLRNRSPAVSVYPG